MEKTVKKNCFVISPIGSPDSETRINADKVFKYVIEEAVTPRSYTVVRADHLSDAGIITLQVIMRLLEDDLVIADLTGANPNVYYELALRHATRKPVIHIHKRGETIPFDMAANRTFEYDLSDVECVSVCKSRIEQAIQNIEAGVAQSTDSVSAALSVINLQGSSNPGETGMAEILQSLSDLTSQVNSLTEGIKKGAFASPGANDRIRSLAIFQDVLDQIERLDQLVSKGAIENSEIVFTRSNLLKKLNVLSHKDLQ